MPTNLNDRRGAGDETDRLAASARGLINTRSELLQSSPSSTLSGEDCACNERMALIARSL